jgi:hypothetical protein
MDVWNQREKGTNRKSQLTKDDAKKAICKKKKKNDKPQP